VSGPLAEHGRTLEVVAGALVDARGHVLIASRPPGKSFAGRWEFPGGKAEPGEPPRSALARELAEELGIEVVTAEPLIAVRHRYPGARGAVRIDCWRVSEWRGTPQPLDGQGLRWCPRGELVDADVLEADRPIVTALVLPSMFVRVPADDLDRASQTPRSGRVAWLASRLPSDPDVARRFEAHGDLVFAIDPRAPAADGAGSVYTTAAQFERAAHRHRLAGRLVRDADEARQAAVGGADFLLVAGHDLDPVELDGIAAAGLPWYLEGRVSSASAPPTGRLQWAAGQPSVRP
jgi:8-oxo-dGTP diphosphatase